MGLLESAEYDLVIGDELTTEVGGLVDSVDGLVDLFVEDMVVGGFGFPLTLNLDLLLQFGKGEFTRLLIQLAQLIVGDVGVMMLVDHATGTQHIRICSDNYFTLITCCSNDEIT